MEIRADVELTQAPLEVFRTYRDRLADLTAYLPNIRRIEVRSREERGSVVELVNEWEGGGDLPAAVRSFLSESVLAWTDHATWDESALSTQWRTEVRAFTGAVQCRGANRFLAAPGGGTRLEIRGELTVDGSKIPGVPRLLSKTVGGTVEKVLVGRIGPNLVEVAQGVGKLLGGR